MNTIVWMLLMLFGLLVAGIFVLLLVLGSPGAWEPSFLKAMRYNIWAEYLALLGHGLRYPRLLSRGTTKIERSMALPGDALVPGASASATYGITIEAPAGTIWPWLVQMGYGRALWYCWSPFHKYPEFRHHISTFRIHPEWQNLNVGDILLDGDALDQCSEKRGAWRVKEIVPERAIVFFSARDFIDGIEFDPQTTRPRQIYGITSWVFYIDPIQEKQTRLLIRTRVELGPALLKMIARPFLAMVDTVFERTILEGIKYRVEHSGSTLGKFLFSQA